MTKIYNASTRRQLFRAAAAVAASAPFLMSKSASAGQFGNPGKFCSPQDHCCFLKGTAILTCSGERPVEELKIGDQIQTLTGMKPIKWIGRRKFAKEESRAWQREVMPVRIARSALADNVPSRDLYLSHKHCIFYDGALIPVGYLVNDTSIIQDIPADVDVIEYYHIEFETHEVLYAEGAAVESFLDDGSGRETYANFAEYERLYGESQSKMTPFAPILAYYGGRDEVKGLVRAAVSKVVDIRDPIQRAYDRLAERAQPTLAE